MIKNKIKTLALALVIPVFIVGCSSNSSSNNSSSNIHPPAYTGKTAKGSLNAQNEQEIVTTLVKISSFAHVSEEIFDEVLDKVLSPEFKCSNNGIASGKGFYYDDIWDKSGTYARSYKNCKNNYLTYNGNIKYKTTIKPSSESLLSEINNLQISNNNYTSTFNGNESGKITFTNNKLTEKMGSNFTWKQTGTNAFDINFGVDWNMSYEEFNEAEEKGSYKVSTFITYKGKTYKLVEEGSWDETSQDDETEVTSFFHPDYGKFIVELPASWINSWGGDLCTDSNGNLDLEQIFNRETTSLKINGKVFDDAFEACK